MAENSPMDTEPPPKKRGRKRNPEKQRKMLVATNNLVEEADEDADDSGSCVTSLSQEESRSDTPTNGVGQQKTKKPRHKSKVPKTCKYQFKCVANYKEEHGHPIFSIQFNNYCTEVDPQIFATVGGNRISIYELTSDKVKLLHCFADAEADEQYYTCAWSYCQFTADPRLAVAGLRGVIRIISPVAMDTVCALVGHGCAVNELQYHPSRPDLLFSGSKDYSVRLWNTRTQVMVAVFGGVDGHRDEVLSLDVKTDAAAMVTCGMDHSLKIWDLTVTELVEAIERSYTHNEKTAKRVFKTLTTLYPDFSTRDVHRNYVDCVRWFGDLVMSKVLTCGNQVGKVFLFDLDVDDPSNTRYAVFSHPGASCAIRQTVVTRDCSTMLCVADDGCIWRFERSK